MSNQPRTRDIIVIGCSAGGVEALPRILQQLPRSVPASVFITLHLAPTATALRDILHRATSLPVHWAGQGDRFERGHVYIAPPDLHLLFNGDHLQLSRTARENHVRPSIDRMFRSAAAAHGSRVIGVLLTGMLDDGVAGLCAIRAAHGLVVVQDPADAAFSDLPRHAVETLAPDHLLPIDAIGAMLTVLVEEVSPVSIIPDEILTEAAMDRAGEGEPRQLDALGKQSTVSCPDCGGPTWGIGARYRCYLGHSNTARELLAVNTTQVESALWSAVRALNDRATTLENLSSDAARSGGGQVAESYALRARETREQAEVARKFMLDLTRPELRRA